MSNLRTLLYGNGAIPEGEYRFYFVTNIAYLFGFCSHAIFLSVFALLGVYEMVLHNVASCAVFALALVCNQKRFYRVAVVIAFFEVMIHATFAVLMVGPKSGFQYYIFVAVPLIFFATTVTLAFRFAMAAMAVAFYMFNSLVLQEMAPLRVVDPAVLDLVKSGNIVGVIAGFSYIGYWYGRITVHAEQSLRAERNKLRERNERMQRELEMARQIQLQLIPDRGPLGTLALRYRPMATIGGDFYDFVTFRDRPRELGIFISDVSGHGVPAALIASMLKSTMLQSGAALADPPLLLSLLNDTLYSKTNDNFVTAFYGICDLDSGEVRFANAGHNLPFVVHAGGVATLAGSQAGCPLAVQPNHVQRARGRGYRLEQDRLPRGAKLLLYTDGLTEARAFACDTEFGETRLGEVLHHARGNSVEALVARLHDELVEYHGSDQFEDDVCIVCLGV